MSRRSNASTGSGSNSPIEIYYRWHGNGHIEYWDKEAEENVTKDSAKLVILDIRSSVTGWSEDDKSKITSNMVKDSSKEPFTVRPFKGKQIAEGLWKEIKDDVKDAGGAFTVNLIAMDADTGKVVDLQLSASNLAAWMDYREEVTEVEIFDGVLEVKPGTQKKKGGTKWTPPVFSLGKLSAKLDKAAEEHAVALEEYFNGENTSVRTKNAASEPDKPAGKKKPAAKQDDPEDDDDLPF